MLDFVNVVDSSRTENLALEPGDELPLGSKRLGGVPDTAIEVRMEEGGGEEYCEGGAEDEYLFVVSDVGKDGKNLTNPDKDDGYVIRTNLVLCLVKRVRMFYVLRLDNLWYRRPR